MRTGLKWSSPQDEDIEPPALVIESLGFDVYAVCNGGALVKEPGQATLHAESYDVTPVAELARELGLTLFAQRDAHELGGADFIVDTGSNWNDATNAHFNNNSDVGRKSRPIGLRTCIPCVRRIRQRVIPKRARQTKPPFDSLGCLQHDSRAPSGFRTFLL